MDFSNVLGLFGGLALFLYGMQMMSQGLEAAAGNKMKQILERLTSNRFSGILVGAGITAAIQSSSATTVMTVGFVNSGMMTLKQAVWVIMGANVGTTITGQLIALDVGMLAPLFAFIGVAFVVFIKRPKFQHYGQITAGLGILFLGMEMMSSSMQPLRNSEAFVNLITTFSNPLVGIAAGAVFTAFIQSSSASVGILQTLASGGLIGLPSAVYVLFGQNIGTCVTALIASVGTSRNAKRATAIHLLFNLIGTVIFVILCITLPVTELVAALTPYSPEAQIANMHTIFNITTTLLLIPFGSQLAKLASVILPERENANGEEGFKLKYINADDHTLEFRVGNSAVAVNNVRRELERMTDMVQTNIELSFNAVLSDSIGAYEKIEETEEYIDFLNKEIAKYISYIIAYETNETSSLQLSAYFKIAGDLERIGDHAINICEYMKLLNEKNISFPDTVRGEVAEMKKISLYALSILQRSGYSADERLAEISVLEQKFDDMTADFRQNQLIRIQNELCSYEANVIYSEMLTDFERIGDHLLNVGQSYTKTEIA